MIYRGRSGRGLSTNQLSIIEHIDVNQTTFFKNVIVHMRCILLNKTLDHFWSHI